LHSEENPAKAGFWLLGFLSGVFCRTFPLNQVIRDL
jgi:hypothetical protein